MSSKINSDTESPNSPVDQNKSTLPAKKSLAAGCIRSLFVFSVSLLLIGFLFSLLGRYFFYAELLGHFRLYFFVLLIPSVAIALLLRCNAGLTGLLVFAMLWASVGTFTIYFPVFQPEPGTDVIRVMSFNLLGINREFAKATSVIRNREPDVITLVEFANEWNEVFRGFEEKYPYRVSLPRWHGYGIAVLSKFPIENSRVIQLTAQHMDNPMIEVEVMLGDTPVRLMAVHLLSPTSQLRTDLRNTQMEEIAKAVGESDLPTVLMGDFNCTPWSPFVSDLLQTTGLRDSRQGFGYQPTWHNRYRFIQIPIDHAFVSPTVHVHDRFVGEDGGSDHLPIVFEFSVAKPE